MVPTILAAGTVALIIAVVIATEVSTPPRSPSTSTSSSPSESFSTSPFDNLQYYEDQIYSQNGEDGILLRILEILGLLPGSTVQDITTGEGGRRGGYYVEFGVEDGTQCNTRILRERFNYTGLLM
jgi:hypothetical protein